MGEPQPRGEVGELCFRPSDGRHDFRYLGDMVARTLPGGWASVRDIVRVDTDGYLYIVDRRTNMIKTGAANVFLA
jgi:bile acid-coenzyme A ligase